MHEVDMTQCLLLAMGDWRRQHEPEQPTVDTVHLLVGDFTCVEPDQLVSTWKAAVAGSWLDGPAWPSKPCPSGPLPGLRQHLRPRGRAGLPLPLLRSPDGGDRERPRTQDPQRRLHPPPLPARLPRLIAMHMPLQDTLGLNLLAANQHQAEHNREHFDAWQLLCLNVMSSPGAGKTSLLERTLTDLSRRWRMAVLEGDMTTQLDAQRLEAVGVPVVRSPPAAPATSMPPW